MADLKSNLQYILNEKNEKIIPENIKKGVKIFNIEGTYEIESTKDYITCNTLAGQIVGDLPVDTDPYIDVTRVLNITDNANISIDDTTLVIE